MRVSDLKKPKMRVLTSDGYTDWIQINKDSIDVIIETMEQWRSVIVGEKKKEPIIVESKIVPMKIEDFLIQNEDLGPRVLNPIRSAINSGRMRKTYVHELSDFDLFSLRHFGALSLEKFKERYEQVSRKSGPKV